MTGSPGAEAPRPLEEERDFLLRSLEDLDREHKAGDVDEDDYLALKDGYTARAAAVLRALEADRGPTVAAAARGRSPGRTVLVGLGVVAFALVAGVLVAQGAGRRDVGEVATGAVNQSVTEKLNEAGRLGSSGDFEGAIARYDEVLADDPGNAEALTYKGWMLTLAGGPAEGLTTLLEAATSHPEYPDVHAFLAIVFFRNGLVEQAARELERLDALDPPPAMLELTASLRTQIAAAQGPTTSTGG